MKRLLFLACASIALAACSKSEMGDDSQSGDGLIRATAAIDGVLSRALADNAAALSGVSFVRFDAVATDLVTTAPAGFNFASTQVISAARATTGAITFSPAQNYDKAADKTAYFRGYHPAGTLASGVVSWTPDGATDILVTDVWNAGRYSSPKTTGMTFKHILARIEVVCKAESGVDLAAIAAMWGNIESIKVTAQPNMTYTYATNTIAASGTAKDFALLNGQTYTVGAFTSVPVPANSNTAVTAAAMVAPAASTAISLKIKTASQSEVTLPITLTGNFDAGNTHTVTLTFKASERKIDATASTITEWGTGKTGDSDVTI